jgi:hypothetical protein
VIQAGRVIAFRHSIFLAVSIRCAVALTARAQPDAGSNLFAIKSVRNVFGGIAFRWCAAKLGYKSVVIKACLYMESLVEN